MFRDAFHRDRKLRERIPLGRDGVCMGQKYVDSGARLKSRGQKHLLLNKVGDLNCFMSRKEK